MTTEKKPEVSLPPPGQLLRQAREAQGLTMADIATRINLRPNLIEQIERDSYDAHLGHTFIRGYLRSYAKQVGIAEGVVLSAYNRLGLEQTVHIDMQSFSRRSRQEASDSKLRAMTWLVVLGLAGLSVAWWWQSTARREQSEEALAQTELRVPAVESEQSSGELQLPQVPVSAPSTAASAALPTSALPAVSSALPVLTPATDATPAAASAAETTVPAAATTPVAATRAVTATEPAAMSAATIPASAYTSAADMARESSVAADDSEISTALDGSNVRLKFNGDCWLMVKDGNGKTLFSGI
ncbi:MAG: RodZ domain-containing protein, partial [Aeromonas sp.]